MPKTLRHAALTLLLLLSALPLRAQDADTIIVTPRSNRLIHNSMVVGIGASNVLDTYLSPYSYTGEQLRLLGETDRWIRPLSRQDGTPRVQTAFLLDADVAKLQSPAKNVDAWAGGIRASFAWKFDLFLRHPRWQLLVGPMLSGYVGAVYNERNGNNPAQAKADLTLDLAASIAYQFPLLKRQMRVRYQLAAPLIGLAFSPNYGQSYYEMFGLGNYDKNVVFAHVGNMPSWRHLLTLDVPLRPHSRTAIRVGYAGNFMQSTFRNLRYHSYSHSFLIGFTKTFYAL